MKITSSAQAGTFESSDILVMVQPNPGKRIIQLDSSVLQQFETSIRQEIDKVLDRYAIDGIHIIAKDKGALNATIAARVETAIFRASGTQIGTSYVNR